MTLRLSEIAIYNFFTCNVCDDRVFTCNVCDDQVFTCKVCDDQVLHTSNLRSGKNFYVCTVCAEYVSGILVKLSLI